MKAHIAALFLILVVMVSACQPQTPPAPQVDTVGTTVAATFAAMTAAAPTEAPTTAVPPTPAGKPVSFQNVSFVIPNDVALGANGEIVAEVADNPNNAPWDIGPTHLRFTFFGYNNYLAKFTDMDIRVYPADHAWSAGNVQRLQAILAAPAAPIEPKDLPRVPYFNAAQMFAAQIKQVNFASGSGVRSVTQYGQAVMPISNSWTFYHFQGLTSDGKYYIIATLPIGAPFLVNGTDLAETPPPSGVPFPDLNTTDATAFETYFQSVTNLMNTSNGDVFSPTLSQLDALIQSITVTP